MLVTLRRQLHIVHMYLVYPTFCCQVDPIDTDIKVPGKKTLLLLNINKPRRQGSSLFDLEISRMLLTK